jgi:dipeptidyl aminopeptidase/acylaminoacyl peptidase
MDSKIIQIANGEFNKNVIFVQNSRDFHENICIYNRDSRSINSLYSPNKDFFQKHPVSKMEKFEINRSNYQIESRLYFPKEIDFSKKCPVIVDIHGGPHGRFEDQISISQEIFTSNNFIVLAVNPRGSSSYGFNFLKEVLNDWGGEDYLDILESIERLSKFNFIDFRKIGLYGHSYGGFMSSWIIGHSKKFKAAVISAPCINLNSMSGTSDIGIKFGEEQWGGIRTFNTEKHLFHSPLSYVENVETPALILCGDADYRCPIEQAEQYYVALKRLDKNVQFVRYPEQNHQMLNIGNPNFIIDYWKRTIKFFNEYLN